MDCRDQAHWFVECFVLVVSYIDGENRGPSQAKPGSGCLDWIVFDGLFLLGERPMSIA